MRHSWQSFAPGHGRKALALVESPSLILMSDIRRKDPMGLSGPKFPGEDVSRTKVKPSGASFSLPCEAQAHPTPVFR